MDRLSERYENRDVLFYHVSDINNMSEDESVTSREFLYTTGDEIYRNLFRTRSKSLVIIDRDGKLSHYQSYQSTISVRRILKKMLAEDEDMEQVHNR